MIKLTATALIHAISPVIEIQSKTGGQSFFKRTLILNEPYIREGAQYNNLVEIDFSGDKMDQLNSFAAGMYVTVEAFVTGREHNGRVFNSIRGLSISLYQQHTAQPQPAQQPQQAPQPQQTYPAATSAAPQPYTQVPGAYPQQTPQQPYMQPQQVQQPYVQPRQPGVADLPFPH